MGFGTGFLMRAQLSPPTAASRRRNEFPSPDDFHQETNLSSVYDLPWSGIAAISRRTPAHHRLFHPIDQYLHLRPWPKRQGRFVPPTTTCNGRWSGYNNIAFGKA